MIFFSSLRCVLHNVYNGIPIFFTWLIPLGISGHLRKEVDRKAPLSETFERSFKETFNNALQQCLPEVFGFGQFIKISH
jgi:hypothetical protein